MLIMMVVVLALMVGSDGGTMGMKGIQNPMQSHDASSSSEKAVAIAE